jgi:hypothetical protein
LQRAIDRIDNDVYRFEQELRALARARDEHDAAAIQRRLHEVYDDIAAQVFRFFGVARGRPLNERECDHVRAMIDAGVLAELLGLAELPSLTNGK